MSSKTTGKAQTTTSQSVRTLFDPESEILTSRSPAGLVASHATSLVAPFPIWLLSAHVTPLTATSKPLSRYPQQSPRLVTSTLVICNFSPIGTVTFHHGAVSLFVCVHPPEFQLGLALPSMARSEVPPWFVELCAVDAPVIETIDGDGGVDGGHTPAIQSSLELELPPLAVALRLHSPSAVQHCAAIGSLSIGSRVAVGSVTHTPERSPASLPSSTQTPLAGKLIGGTEGGGEKQLISPRVGNVYHNGPVVRQRAFWVALFRTEAG